MKVQFLVAAEDNKDFPIGGAIWTRIRPEDVVATKYTSWKFGPHTRRIPEFRAPGLGKKNNTVQIELEVGENATGVLYALGGTSAGLTCYMDDGFLCDEYNLFIIERYQVKSKQRIAPGKHTMVIDTTLAKPGAPLTVVMTVDAKEVARMTTKRSAPVVFTASETYDAWSTISVAMGAERLEGPKRRGSISWRPMGCGCSTSMRSHSVRQADLR